MRVSYNCNNPSLIVCTNAMALIMNSKDYLLSFCAICVRASLNNNNNLRFEDGNVIFFGGTISYDHNNIYLSLSLTLINAPCSRFNELSTCSASQSVCGPSRLLQHEGRVNISWDPLPRHLQNGADVTSYTIQYTPKSTGITAKISSLCIVMWSAVKKLVVFTLVWWLNQ